MAELTRFIAPAEVHDKCGDPTEDAGVPAVNLQHLLTLPMRRQATVSATESGMVRVEVTDGRTGGQIAWMEMDPKEADLFAGVITATVTQIIAASRAAEIVTAPSKQVVTRNG